MSHSICCYRCGASLAAMSLPLMRQDLCLECNAELRVCKMCVHYDKGVARQCREDNAEDVTQKELANFCEWFEPSETAFKGGGKSEADNALAELEAMFSGLGDKSQK